MKRLLSALVFLTVAYPASAMVCYKDVITARKGDIICGSNKSSSADFENGCSVAKADVVEKVETPCIGVWINSPLTSKGLSYQSHQYTCQLVGLVPGDVNGMLCASKTLRPQSGLGWESIVYPPIVCGTGSMAGPCPKPTSIGGKFIYPGSLSSGFFCAPTSAQKGLASNNPPVAYACKTEP